MKPEQCPKYDECPKLREIKDDMSLLESQRKEMIQEICGECPERPGLRYVVGQ